MAEPTLTGARLEIAGKIGEYLGVSRTVADWSAEFLADVLLLIESGERQFYNPSFRPVPQAPVRTHVWSWLTATMSLSFSNGTSAYDLPDDFAVLLDEEFSYTTSDDWGLKLVPLKLVLEKRQGGTSMPSGFTKPFIAAITPKTFTHTTGQRQTLEVWPTPTGSLTAKARYRMNPDAMSGDTSYARGGSQYYECLLESCLAAAEEFQNDESTLHRDRFQELLAAAVALDLQTSPETKAA